MKADIKSMTLQELTAFMAQLSEKPFRARQLFSWMHEKMASSYDEMTNLPLALREKLKQETEYTVLQPVMVLTSKTDGTQKYLFALNDGNVIESVLMRYHYGLSVCISSQCGCRMGCTFCASTIGGRVRDLTAAEMLEQIYRISVQAGERVSHVVVMGSGEPLDNYDQLLRFIHLANDPAGMNISQRNITVSTCGIVENMYRLAREKLQITLALSLHASSQEKRKALMPIAGKYPLDQVLEACRAYSQMTGRRMTFEYSLVGGVNDTPSDARALASLLSGMNGHINLIPVNPVRESGYVKPDRKGVLRFKNDLEKCGINVTIRRELGQDISASCGQLRRSYYEKEQKKDNQSI